MKPTKAFLTLCSVLTFLVGGKTACAAAEPRIYLRGTFAPFAMCMANMSIANQVSFAEKVGFTGMGLSGMVKYQVNQAVNLPQVVSGKFKIPSVLWYSNINEPINVPWLDSILDDAKKVDMAVWMVSGGNKNRLDSTKSLAVSRLKVVAERCRAKGVRMVLYPHLGTAFETAEDGMEALDSLRRHGYSEVKLSIHLCHEVKKGNGGRIASIVSKVAPYLAMATVNGADSNTYRLNDGWATAIMPLDAGTYDPKVFLKALSQAKFDGPIELHTYGLKSPVDPAYDGHFERSLARWNEWVTNVPPVEASASPAPLGTDLVAYAICMAGQSIANQVGFAEKAGYTSIGLAGMIQYQLAQAASLPQIATGKVRIRNVRWYSSIRDTLDTVWLDAVLADTRKLGASVWMVSGGNKDKSDATKSIAISKLRRVADRCKVAGVPLVVYPHQGTLFDGVEEGLAALDSLRRWGHPEVGISMDYSHELARGNQLRIPALVAKAAPYLAIATVSGADVDGAGVVKPLDQGTLEIAPYLDALATAGFSGAVQLQTAGLPSPADANYDGHLERSLTRWNRIVAPVVDHRLPIEGGLVPFATCMATQSVASQVEASSKAGYSGIGLAGLIRYQMDQLAVLPQVASGAFRVRSAMWYTSIQDALDTAWLDGVLVAAKKMGTSIWMVSGGNRDKSDATKSVAIAKLHRVADRCRNAGVDLVVYPHLGTLFDGVEDGLQVLDSLRRLGHPEVRISLDLSHELTRGGMDRILPMVEKAGPSLGIATISGVDAGGKIRALDEGSLAVGGYLEALVKIGYKGPILLHTSGLSSPFSASYDNHLARSLAKWQEWVRPVGSNALPALKEESASAMRDGKTAARVHWQTEFGRVRVHAPEGSTTRLFSLDGREIPGVQESAGVWVFPARGVGNRLLRVHGPAGIVSAMVPAL